MATFDLRLSDIKIGKYSPGEYRTSTGNVISREVTVFNSIKHHEAFVTTGWKYKDGAATDHAISSANYFQAGDGGVDFKVDLFTGGKRIYNDAVYRGAKLRRSLRQVSVVRRPDDQLRRLLEWFRGIAGRETRRSLCSSHS
jgi:hypothetical protein